MEFWNMLKRHEKEDMEYAKSACVREGEYEFERFEAG